MYSVLLRAGPNGSDDLIGELWEHGTAGILEESLGLRAFFVSAEALDSFVAKRPTQIIETRTEPSTTPAFLTSHWDAIPVGNLFWIAPSWIGQPTPAGRYRLTVDGANAFGSGRHESTQLVLEALEHLPLVSSVVVDVGCGTGILSRAAQLLGAHRVFACDIHSASIELTRPHASAVFLGSVDSLCDAVADIVLANISAKVIDRLAPDLVRVVKPGGWLILAGFVEENPPARFTPQYTLIREGWACWICRPDRNLFANTCSPLTHSPDWW